MLSCFSVIGVGVLSFWFFLKEVLSLMGVVRMGFLFGLWKFKGGEVEGVGGGEVVRGLVRREEEGLMGGLMEVEVNLFWLKLGSILLKLLIFLFLLLFIR